MFEITVGVGVVKWSVFGKAFHVIRALHLVQHGMATVVGTCHQLSMPVKIEAPSVASPFTEQFKSTRHRMVAPDSLLKFNATNFGCYRAPLSAIKPTVWPPYHAIGMGMGVFHTKPGKKDLRIAIWKIVSIFVGIKKQVRRLKHIYAAMTERQSCGQVEASDKVFGFSKSALRVWILQNGNTIRTTRPARWWIGHFVPNRSQILILRNGLQPCRIRVLQILNNPHSATAIKRNTQRLPNQRFRGNQSGFETRGNRHAGQ